MTKTQTRPITKATVQKELRRIKAENPDAVNPGDYNYAGNFLCVYHKGRGRNIHRCIIGQLGYNLGLPTPKADAGGVDDIVDPYDGVWAGRFTDAAEEYMREVQERADGDIGQDPIPWGQVKL